MRHTPNIISFIRICLIPFFVWNMLNERFLPAGVILVCSGVSDALDGFLARRFNWMSKLGKVLDPAADKLTQVAVSITLGYIVGQRYPWIWWFFAILLVKELLMLALGAELLKKGVTLDAARWPGKVNTILFYVTMAVLIFFPDVSRYFIGFMMLATSLCAIFAAISYTPDYLNYKKDVKKDG
jgi:Phosphatidylglycerophosphate synthase